MSDSSQINIPNSIALTSDVMYTLKPSAPRSRAYRLSVAPLNKNTFIAGDQCIIEIPTGRKNTYYDPSQSYLKFTVQCATNVASAANTPGSTGVYIENTAYSFWQRLDVYNSSNLLETINEYGQLANTLIDTSLTQSDKAGLSSLIGCNNLTSVISAAAGTASTILQTPGDRSGLQLATNTSVVLSNPYTFCLPVLSGVIGMNASKMIPLGSLSSPIRTEWYLANNDDAIYYGTNGAGANWQISNVELECCFVEILDDINVNEGTQYISTTSFRSASTYLPSATAGEFSCLVPFRAASITGLYARFRPFVSSVQGADATAAYRKSASINPNFNQAYFRVGSSIIPQKPIYILQNNGTASEAYAELLKSFHALSSSIGNSAISHDMYNVNASAIGAMPLYYIPQTQATNRGTHNNSFMLGIECQSFSNRNDTILSGLSTLNSQIYFTGVISSGRTVGGTNNLNYTIDFFSSMDMILVIENGVMSAKF